MMTQGGADEECDQSDEEDWRMEVEENGECDGINDILSDDEDEPQRNRQRMTLQGTFVILTSGIVV